jgi:hypothetical protein
MEGTMIWTLAEVNKLATGQLYWYAGRYHSGQRIGKLRPAERTAFEQAKQDGYLVCTSRGSAELKKVWWPLLQHAT